jgi:hypothetical protein
VKRRPFKKNEYGDALEMTPNEKKISFLNRYFAFKKISHVNAEKVAMELIDDTVTERKVSRASVIPTQVKKPAKKSEKTLERKKARPLNKKIMLIAASEAIDDAPEAEVEPEPEVNIVVEKPAAVEKKARKPRAKKVVLAVNSETKEQAKENAEEVKEKALEEQQNEKEVYETEGTIIKESETPAPKKKAASKKKVTLKLEE